jgi:hypothetical protein
MKILLQSPVVAALILAAALVYSAHAVASPRLALAPSQRLEAASGIVIEAPNGFHVDVHGEVRVPETMTIRAELKTDAPPK